LKVITDLTLDISEGEILAVLGSSGSGKSLLAHAIFGILPENANLNGKIKYKGKELSQKDKEEIRGKEIALIPQSVNFLDPLMKISDQAIGHTESEEEKKAKKVISTSRAIIGAIAAVAAIAYFVYRYLTPDYLEDFDDDLDDDFDDDFFDDDQEITEDVKAETDAAEA